MDNLDSFKKQKEEVQKQTEKIKEEIRSDHQEEVTETGDEDNDKYIKIFTTISSALMYGALELVTKGAADMEGIDHVWMSSAESEWGPSDMIKRIGTDKIHDVLSKQFAAIENDPEKDLHDEMLNILKNNDF